MANLSKSQAELMNELYKKYDLNPDDIHNHKHYKIITRGGIEKIIAGANMEFDAKLLEKISDVENVVFEGKAWLSDNPDKKIWTTASANKSNCTSPYLPEMAEKRLLSRMVLKLLGFYKFGFYGEDEADDFSKAVKESRAAKKYSTTVSEDEPIAKLRNK